LLGGVIESNPTRTTPIRDIVSEVNRVVSFLETTVAPNPARFLPCY